MSPSTGFFDLPATTTRHGGTRACIHRDSIAIAQTCRHSRVASAARDDLGPRPNGSSEFQQRCVIFLSRAASEKNSNPSYFARQNAKNFRDLIQRRQAQVGRRQFSRLDDCAIGNQGPCGLRSPAFDPEYFFSIHLCERKCKRKFIGGHRPPLQSSPPKRWGARCEGLHLPIVILSASEGPHLFGGDHTITLASSRTIV